jgi:uncharacterized protein (TIGR02453 family)
MDTTSILSFLTDLKTNNNREWFEDNKERYKEAHAFFLDIVQHTIEGIGKFDQDIAHLDPKKCAYRIYRDIRFSNDKTPYKIHFGAEMAPGGRRSGLAGYYIHIQPGESIIGGGIWHPAPDNLTKIRQEIDYNGEDLKKIINSKEFKYVYDELKGDKLKRPPKGYDPNHVDIELLKFKDFLAYAALKDKEVKSKDYLSNLIDNLKVLKPLNDFLNVAVT